MTSYAELIASARLISHFDTTLTTGDNSYDGTALEVSDENGNELFHVVIDGQGEQQLLVFSSQENLRIPLHKLEELLAAARQHVKQVAP